MATQTVTINPYPMLAGLANLSAYTWAIVRSRKRWKTVYWMAVSLLGTWVLVAIIGAIAEPTASKLGPVGIAAWRLVDFLSALTGGDPDQAWEYFNAGAFSVGFVSLLEGPSFMVPAIVGIVHARRHRRQPPPENTAT
jgi:hypothetical protein